MSPNNGSAIEGTGLHKAYGGVLALEDATLRAAPGEVTLCSARTAPARAR
jgi:ABC-type sugar transport system ATPase subunit